LIQELVDVNTPDHGRPLLSVDTIYYPGVKEYLYKCIKRGATAHVIFNAYTEVNGDYDLIYDEGNFTISDGYVIMRPEENPSTYKHKIFKYNPYHTTNMVEDGVIWECRKFIPTSDHSALVYCVLIQG